MNRPTVVLISGGTASGKTTLAGELVRTTEALLVTHDRYYRDIPYPRGFNFDHPDALDTELLEEHIGLLKSGHSVELPVYDFATHSRLQRTEYMKSGPLLIVEGILVLTSDILVRAADLIIYVDAPDDIRLMRRIRRDVAERGRTVESVLDQYMMTVRPMHETYVLPGREKADLILDGTDELGTILDIAISRIEGSKITTAKL